jgi:nitrite reductase/ring-hydroxylating ferredoxin subunit
MDFVESVSVESLPPGSHTVISINGMEVLLFNTHGEISAIENICLHKGGPLVRARPVTNKQRPFKLFIFY